MSFGKIGLTTVAVAHDLSGMPLVLLRKQLIRLWNSILPEPKQPSAQLSKLIRFTACKKTKHTVSRWYRAVYIPWLVASYDTHNCKRWMNYNPTGGNMLRQTHPLERYRDKPEITSPWSINIKHWYTVCILNAGQPTHFHAQTGTRVMIWLWPLLNCFLSLKGASQTTLKAVTIFIFC